MKLLPAALISISILLSTVLVCRTFDQPVVEIISCKDTDEALKKENNNIKKALLYWYKEAMQSKAELALSY